MAGFLPTDAAKAAADAVGGVLGRALKTLTGSLRDLGRAAANVAGPLLGGLTRALGSLAEQVVKPFTSKLGAAFHRLLDPEEFLKPFARRVAGVFREMAAPVARWLQPLADRLGKAFGGLGGAAESWVKPITSKLGASFGRLFDVEGTLKPLARGMLGLTKTFGTVLAGAGVATGAIAGLGSVLGTLVGKAAPVEVEKFQIALNDTLAVIGRALIPVMQTMTELMRLAGDTFATFTGLVSGFLAAAMVPLTAVFRAFFDVAGRVGAALGKVLAAATPILAGLAESFTAIFSAVSPVINLLIDLIGGLLAGAMGVLASVVEAAVPVVVVLAETLGAVVRAVSGWVRDLLALFGIDVGEGGPGTKAGASVGAAVRKASIGGVTDLANRAYTSAYTMGSARDIPREQLDTQKKMLHGLDQLPGRLADKLKGLTPGGMAARAVANPLVNANPNPSLAVRANNMLLNTAQKANQAITWMRELF